MKSVINKIKAQPVALNNDHGVAKSVGAATFVVVAATFASAVIPFDFGMLDNVIVLGVLAKLFHSANFRRR